jgi:HAE1 family hydrophobic/amphiphilic exporter-1
VEQVYAPPRIEHIDRARAITVSSDIYQSSIGEIMVQIRPYIQQMDLPANVRVDYGGEFEEQQEAFSNLFLILGISLILVYIVMAGQFESFKDPFVIMFSIPFAFTGVILALFLTSTKLSVIAFIGGVILVGIVVKNAIVLVDYINLLRGRGEELYESIVNSGRSRLRPVLMTSLTTILAMVPLALSGGEGAETWRPMAIAVIGGLTFSTLVTLILVPVMYAIIERKSAGKNKKRSLVS